MATQEQGTLLWEPPDELRRARDDDALHALARDRARAAASTTTTRCGSGRSTTSRRSGRSIWEFFDVAGATTTRCSADALDARRRVVPRAPSSPTPSTSSAASADDARGDPPRLRAARRSASGRGTSCARRPRASRAGLQRDGRRARRPRRRLHAEHPRDDRRLPRHRVRSARSGRAARPTSARAASSTASPRSSRRCCSRVDGYRYGGKDFDRRELVERVQGEMPSLEHTVTLGYLDGDGGDWDEAFPATDERARRSSACPFDHPLWVLYSSGTTGLPKAIVHGAGRHPARAPQEARTCTSTRRTGDRVFWFTTTGWMMWNFLVGVLLTDASIVLYDGNPGDARHGRAVGPRRGDRHDHASAPAPPTSPPA